LCPLQTERTVQVEFSEKEKEEYNALDNATLAFYTGFKSEHGHQLSKFYLRLTQKLTPLRIAASGGRVPLDEDKEGEDSEESHVEDESATPKKKKAKKEQRFSEFAYKSKVNALVSELISARDKDPNCKANIRGDSVMALFLSSSNVHAVCVVPQLRASSSRSSPRPSISSSRNFRSTGFSSGRCLATCQ
jgi:hypothetical protein